MNLPPSESPTLITSRDNPLLVRIRRLLQDPVAYRKLGQIWLEGEHLCNALLARGGQPVQAIVSEAGWSDGATRELAHAAPRIGLVPDSLFKTLSGLESPARMGFILDHVPAAALQPGVDTVVLDRLQDAGNVGTILRSAAAFGVAQVVALKGTAALWSPKVLRAGMGAHFGLHLVEGVEVPNLNDLAVPLVATSSHASAELPLAPLPRRCAWVFGHEGQGVDPVLLDRCALTVRIPQPGGEESLNVASAAAVCLYEAARRRALP